MIRDVRAAYEAFEFYRVYQRIYQFCSVELSSFYLDVLKDRLYAEPPTAPTAAPRSSSWPGCTTRSDPPARADHPAHGRGAWDFLPRPPASRRASTWPSGPSPTRPGTTQTRRRWDELLAVRDEILRELEKLRRGQGHRQRQEASVTLATDDRATARACWRRIETLLTTLAIVSDVRS